MVIKRDTLVHWVFHVWWQCVTFLLPPGIKGLIEKSTLDFLSFILFKLILLKKKLETIQ